ncbi:unnamed protein product [Acanthosepion pharaonis]|uniref:RING-CH-type domain-containing protein n=1 Tax=Acanthosepion pharaonis TaxID=158019 RepID=A0A812DBI6_ACAPH|nr:unnamed protein product [Sepia pharaonis]
MEFSLSVGDDLLRNVIGFEFRKYRIEVLIFSSKIDSWRGITSCLSPLVFNSIDPLKWPHLLDGHISKFMSNMAYCPWNCSGHGICNEGKCICRVQFSGGSCNDSNKDYYLAFGSIFVILSCVSLIQLCVCIWSEYIKEQKHSFWSAFKITTQKLLYALIICATAIRAVYFFTKFQLHLTDQISSNLWCAYYPLLLTGFTLIVCYWAEAFHLNIPFEKPRFLSKSFVGFMVFNSFIYLLFGTRFILTGLINDHHNFDLVNKIFDALFAFLMFLVVAFFLIYGVEVYFRVRGAFAQSQCTVNQRQLHLSRLGLVIQAILQLITALFLLSDVLKEFWRDKLPVISQNIYDIGFRIIEFGVSLWFPCVLWNCCRPEELWVLNPKNIFQSFKHERDFEREPVNSIRNRQKNYNTIDQSHSADTSQNFLCWICYDPDNHKAGPLIQACNCKGDMSAVHHECLRKWLVESATTAEDAKCRVCLQKYSLQESHYWLPKGTKFRHWILVSFILVAMIACPFGAYAVAHELTKTYVQVLAFGFTAIFELFCIKVLTVNAIKMYKRGRLSSDILSNRHLRQISLLISKSYLNPLALSL